MARVAVTGATGFVGGTVAGVLADQGHDVICLVRRDPGEDFPWPWELTDTGSVADLERVLDHVDAVAHLAILNDFALMYADRRAGWDGYVGMTERIVDAANVTGSQVALISTDWVFDGVGHLYPEDFPPNPVNYYGVLKVASELAVLNRADRGFVARVGGVQGLHQTQKHGPRTQDVGFGYFVLSLVDALSQGERYTVWEDPHINNVATPIVSPEIGALLGRGIDRGVDGILHFAGATAVTRRELAMAACEVFDLDPGMVDFGPVPDDARLPAPVPFDTSMDGAETMARLGTVSHSVEAQLRALREEVETGHPVPLS